MNRIEMQFEGRPGADLGFWLSGQIVGQPMAMGTANLTALVEALAANRFSLPRDDRTRTRITDKGTAILEVHGFLVDRSPMLGGYAGMHSYESIAEQCRRLASNDDVERVVLDINSPGGMALGVQDAADALVELGKKKPIHAIAHNQAVSGGYWLAASCQSISVTSDGEVGSIGVRAGHISYAGSLDREGVTVTMFQAGRAKTDLNGFVPLDHGAAAERQFDIDRTYDRFVAHVAKHRPMTEEAVRATEARVFVGARAVELGLADKVETLDALVSRLEQGAKLKKTAGATGAIEPNASGATLVTEKAETSKPAASQSTAELQAAIAEVVAAMTANKDKGGEQSVAAPQGGPADAERVLSIVECEEARGKAAIAAALARAGLTLDAARGVLALVPSGDGGAASAASASKSGVDLEAVAMAALRKAFEAQMARPGSAAGVRPEASAEDGTAGRLTATMQRRFGKK